MSVYQTIKFTLLFYICPKIYKMHSYSFPPFANKNANILILGSMPGKKSLEMQEYYAYKYNAFWKIIFNLLNFDYTENYEIKLNLLKDNKIALWDSLQFCYRDGSADANIKDEIPNDFKTFFEQHTKIKTVFFNGNAAMKYYKKYVGFNKTLNYHLLPSTSPANARMSFEEKLKNWSLIIKISADEQ